MITESSPQPPSSITSSSSSRAALVPVNTNTNSNASSSSSSSKLIKKSVSSHSFSSSQQQQQQQLKSRSNSASSKQSVKDQATNAFANSLARLREADTRQQTVFSGWLLKKPVVYKRRNQRRKKHSRLGGLLMGNKSRFFRLTNCALFYYLDESRCVLQPIVIVVRTKYNKEVVW